MRVNNFYFSLRSKLFLLLLAGLLPALILVIYNVAIDNQRAAAEARAVVTGLSQTAAEGHHHLIDVAHVTLKLLSQLPSALLTSPGCASVLKAFSTSHPIFDNAAVLNPDGEMLCALVPPPAGRKFADRPWFRTVIKNRRFTISEVVTARTSARSSVIFALPVLNNGGEVTAIVGISLRTQRLHDVVDLAQLPPRSTFTVVDRNGAIMVRQPDLGEWLGKRHPAFDQLKPGDGKESRHVKALGVDGVERFYTFATVRTSEGDQAWFVAIGIPEQQVYAPIQQKLQRNLIWVILVAIVIFTVAWFGCDKLVVQRLTKLAGATVLVAQGDFSSRTGMASERDEIGRLAGAVDQMAEALRARDADRQEIEKRRAELAAIVETSTDAIVSRDLDGIITSWNQGAERLFGYSKEEMIGRAGFEHMPAADIETLKGRLERISRNERIESFDTIRIKKDGEAIQVSMTLSPIVGASGQVIGCAAIARDISERKSMENRLKALHEINLAVSSTLDLQTILHNLLEQLDRLFPYAVSHIRLKNKITGEIEPVACRNIDETVWKSETKTLRPWSIHRVIFETKRPAAVRDMHADERIAPGGFWMNRGMTSYLGVPMILMDEVTGVLSLLTANQHDFSEEEIAFVEVIANQAGMAIHNSQLYETSKLQNQALEANRSQIQRLIMAQLNARDEEAKRIAEVLHEDSSQLLVAIRLALDNLDSRSVADFNGALQPIKDLLGQVEERLRSLSHELHPAILDQMGLRSSLEILAEQIRLRSGIQVQVDAAINGRLSTDLELCLYRVAQEVLANVTRHSQAKHVEIQLGENEDQVHCRIQDDGIGFDPNATSAGQSIHGSWGLGLALARERIEALGGIFNLESAPGAGTRIQITIPKEKIHVYPATTG